MQNLVPTIDSIKKYSSLGFYRLRFASVFFCPFIFTVVFIIFTATVTTTFFVVPKSYAQVPELEDTQKGDSPKNLENSLEDTISIPHPAVLVAEYGTNSWLVSEEGNLLSPISAIKDPDMIVTASELPRLGGLEGEFGSISVISGNNSRYRYAFQSFNYLRLAGGFSFEVYKYILNNDGSLEVIPNDSEEIPRVILISQDYEGALLNLRKLSIVLRDLTRRKEHASVVDLRYNNQAIIR